MKRGMAAGIAFVVEPAVYVKPAGSVSEMESSVTSVVFGFDTVIV